MYKGVLGVYEPSSLLP